MAPILFLLIFLAIYVYSIRIVGFWRGDDTGKCVVIADFDICTAEDGDLLGIVTVCGSSDIDGVSAVFVDFVKIVR